MADSPAETKTDTSLPASPLSSADAGKHQHAEPAKETADVKANGKDNAPPADASPAADAKPEQTEKASAAETAKPDDKAAADKPAETKESKPAEKPAEKAPETKAEETKPEAKADGKAEDTKADTKDAPAEKPQAPPVYDVLKVPEGVTLDTKQVEKFDQLVSSAEIKARTDPHAAIAELRQNAIDMYVGELQQISQRVQQNQMDVWNRHVESLVSELKADPVLGGNNLETKLGNAKYAIESLLPSLPGSTWTKQDAEKWIQRADRGGVSHDRLTIKMLNTIYDLLAEPEPLPGEKPAPFKGKEPGARGWYDKTDSKPAA